MNQKWHLSKDGKLAFDWSKATHLWCWGGSYHDGPWQIGVTFIGGSHCLMNEKYATAEECQKELERLLLSSEN